MVEGPMEDDEKRGDRAAEPIENIWREIIRGCSCRGHASVSDARSYHRARNWDIVPQPICKLWL